VVRGAVVAGDAGPVEAEEHRLAVEGDVEVDLVDGPGQEGRIDGDHRPQATHRHARRRCDGMLLGDADVEAAVREALAERQQAGRVGHGGRDRHEFGAGLGRLHQRLGEGLGVAARLDARRVVHVLDRVAFGGLVAASLLGEHVDDDGPLEGLAVLEGLLDLGHVVPVEGAQVVDAEGLEERRRLEHLPDGGLGGVDAPLDQLAHPGQVLGQFLEAPLPPHVGGVGADADQALGEASHGGGVGASVVVEDDGDAEAAVAEVVEALEGHAARHRPVADYGNDAPAAAGGRLRGGESVGVREHSGGVRVLDPVVVRLGPRGVAGQAARLAQCVEVGQPAGQHLVDIGLVAGVPQDDVVGAVEGPVQGDRQLDGSQVRPQVPARAVDGLDQAGTDLGGQGAQFGRAEVTQVSRGPDRVEAQGRFSVVEGGDNGSRRTRERGPGRGPESVVGAGSGAA
jgi:hypothetical protein